MSSVRGTSRVTADRSVRSGRPRGADHDGENSPPDGSVPAGGQAARVPLRELVDGRLLDELLERSKDEAGGLRLTGAGSMLGELVSAVLERALQGELEAHLGYGRHDAAGNNTGTRGTGTSPRRCRPGWGRCRCRCRGTGRARSSRC
jgi:hypothetical protein